MRPIVLIVLVIAALAAVPVVRTLHAAPTTGTVEVAVAPGGKMEKYQGGVGATLPFNYVPARVTVKAGTTVVWTNKSILPEPHTVTFLEPNPQTGELKGGPPFIIVRPKAGKEGSKNPLDMEYLENPAYLFPSEMTGVKFRNSGFLWPARMGPPNSQASWKTTFTDADAGKTLTYTCALHPWMTGQVVVRR